MYARNLIFAVKCRVTFGTHRYGTVELRNFRKVSGRGVRLVDARQKRVNCAEKVSE